MLRAAALFESLILHAQTYEREYNKKEPPTKVGDSRLVKRHSGKHCVPGRHSYWSRTRGLSNSDGLRLLIFPQPLGEALKNQNAAPTTPPCFCRRQWSSSLHWADCLRCFAPPPCSSPTGAKEKIRRCKSNSGFFGGVPSGTRTHGLQIHNLAR